MECNVRKTIEDIRCEILDPDGDIWSDKLLVTLIQATYAEIYSLRCDLFATPKEIDLTPNSCLQDVCEQCANVISVISVNGQDCIPPDEESTQDNLDQLGKYFQDYNCTDAEGNSTAAPYAPTAYEMVQGTDCNFRLSEATPASPVLKAVVLCSEEVDFCDGIDTELPSVLCGKLAPLFRNLLLSKIYGVDRKSDNLVQLSQLHYRYYQDGRDWLMLVDFSKNQSDYYLYRRTSTDRSD